MAEAKRYGRQELTCTLIDRGLDLAYLAVMALLVAPWLDRWLSTSWAVLDGSRSLRLVVLYAIVFGLHVCVSFPLSYYSGHWLEHRYKLSKLTFLGWLWRYTKQLVLAAVFGAAMFLGLFWIIWTTGPYWWLVAAGAFFLVSVVMGQLTPVLIMPLFYKIEKLDDPELTGRMTRLAEGTGLSIEGVYRMGLSEETVKANAMLAGLGRTRRVLMGDTLLAGFSPDEIEVVFAHEIGHHVFRHLRKLILAGIVYSTAGFWVCDSLLAVWLAPVNGDFNRFEIPVAVLPVVMLILTAFMMILEPLSNCFQRHYERQSDRYALERTGLKEAYVSAYRKLSRQNKDDPDPPRLEVFLFHSHPPIGERVAMAEDP